MPKDKLAVIHDLEGAVRGRAWKCFAHLQEG